MPGVFKQGRKTCALRAGTRTLLLFLAGMISVLLCSCITVPNEEGESPASGPVSGVPESASEDGGSGTGANENGDGGPSEYVSETSDLCTELVRMFVDEGYSFSPVSEDVRAKDIVWVWENTDRSLTIQFKEYLVGRKSPTPEIVIVQLVSPEQAGRLASLLSEAKKEEPDIHVKAFGDGVVVIASAEQMKIADALVEQRSKE